jgi:DNA-binding response OmpR family regulator
VVLGRHSVAVVTPQRFEGQLLVDLIRTAGAQRSRLYADSEMALEQIMHQYHGVLIVALDAAPTDGLAWVRRLRRIRTCKSRTSPVFMLARSLTLSVAESCRHSGANAVIGMPVSNATLINTIKKVLARPRPFIEEAGYVGPCRRAGIVTVGIGARRRTDSSSPSVA